MCELCQPNQDKACLLIMSAKPRQKHVYELCQPIKTKYLTTQTRQKMN